MSLGPGYRLGSYEILSLLGVGGMGEVYRARDARLHRDVALKLLPDLAAADPDRRERFTREALAVAALNHPHIVTIHSVEDTGSTVFLTMELVEGRSLAEVLPSGGLPLDRVLTIGIAVAEAMSAAHQKGITHRDLKPANIMLGEGEQAGRIKVLDFGLAKVVEAQREAAAASMLPTEATGPTAGPTAPATAEGRILGTVAYMAPEQAEGRSIDARSDLFSLGVVLYEMATGRRPFTGETNLSILSSILKDTPRPVTEVNPALPSDLGRIIRRALAKDPERRYQSAKDLRNDLEDLKASLRSGEGVPSPTAQVARPASGSAPAVAPTAPAAPATSSDSELAVALVRKHSLTLVSVAVLLLVLAVGAYVLLRRDAAPAAPSEERAAGPSPTDVEITQLTTSGNAERPAISPDGRYVAYVQHEGDDYSLWIRQTTSTSNVQIVPPTPGVALFGATFTPDGTSIDFVRQTAGAPTWDVWRVPFLGGTPRPFVADVSTALSWSPDGRRIAFLRTRITPALSSQLIVVDADGGQERVLSTSGPDAPWISLVAPWRPSFGPAWSPDGRLLAIAAAASTGAGGTVHVLDVETGSRQDVPVNGTSYGLSWLDAQSLVINHPNQLGGPGQLFRVPYPSGGVSRLSNDPNDYAGVSLSSSRGEMVTSRRDPRMDIWVGDSDGRAGTDVVRRAPGSIHRIAWAGDRLLYPSLVSGRPTVLRILPGEATPEEVIPDALTPGTTTDGRTIAFVTAGANVLESLDLWTADANGRRIAKLVSGVSAEKVIVTPDDRSVIYTSIFGGTVSIWMVPLSGGTPAKLADGLTVAVSPDGTSIAFGAQGPQGTSMFVCGLPMCAAPRRIAPINFDDPLAWTPDGRGVAFARDGNIWVQPLGGGAPRQLTRFTDNRPIWSFAWSRDGKRLALTRSSVTNDIVLFRGLR